jgi:hypothetical protein
MLKVETVGGQLTIQGWFPVTGVREQKTPSTRTGFSGTVLIKREKLVLEKEEGSSHQGADSPL